MQRWLNVFCAFLLAALAMTGLHATAQTQPRDLTRDVQLIRNQRDNEAHAKSEFMLELAETQEALAASQAKLVELSKEGDDLKAKLAAADHRPCSGSPAAQTEVPK